MPVLIQPLDVFRTDGDGSVHVYAMEDASSVDFMELSDWNTLRYRASTFDVAASAHSGCTHLSEKRPVLPQITDLLHPECAGLLVLQHLRDRGFRPKSDLRGDQKLPLTDKVTL